jgi:TusA-related sulfurtransferase
LSKQQYSVSKSIDVRGVSCPLNAVRAKQAIAALGEDELIEVTVDAGESLIRIVRSINDAGYRIINSKQLENAVAIIVGKGKAAVRQ